MLMVLFLSTIIVIWDEKFKCILYKGVNFSGHLSIDFPLNVTDVRAHVS